MYKPLDKGSFSMINLYNNRLTILISGLKIIFEKFRSFAIIIVYANETIFNTSLINKILLVPKCSHIQ